MRFAQCGLESHKATHNTQSLQPGLYSLVFAAWTPQPGLHSFHRLASAASIASSAWPLQPGIHSLVSPDPLTLKLSPRLALHGSLQDAHSKVSSAQGPQLQDCPTSRRSPPRIKAPYSEACSTPGRSNPRLKNSPGACSRTESSPRTRSPPGTQENHWGKVPTAQRWEWPYEHYNCPERDYQFFTVRFLHLLCLSSGRHAVPKSCFFSVE